MSQHHSNTYHTTSHHYHTISHRKVGRLYSCLYDVGGAVEGGAHNAVEVVPHRRPVGELDFVGDNRPPQTRAGKARVLGERVHLAGATKQHREGSGVGSEDIRWLLALFS